MHSPDEHPSGVSRFAFVAGALLWIAVALSLFAVWRNHGRDVAPVLQGTPSELTQNTAAVEETPSEEATEASTASVKLSFPARRLPDFEFDECMGGKLSLEGLKGQRWVASFVFTRCTSTCPVISRSMKDLHDRVVRSSPEVKYVSFTVDPKYDTVEVMKNYSEIWTTDHENWKFVTGPQQNLYELIVNGFGLYVKENLGESRMPGFEVAHSNRVVLVNEDGIPVGTFLGTNDDDMARLRRILTGRDEFPEPGPSLSFSSADGSALPIQIQVIPVDDSDAPADAPSASDEESDSKADNSADDSEDDDVPKQNDSSGGPVGSSDSDTGSGQQVKLRSVAEHNATIDQRLPEWAAALPPVNASLNLLATLTLMAGFRAIRSGRKNAHRNLMVTSFVVSTLFLICYLTYHYALGKYTGEHGRRFDGSPVASLVYQFVLWPHVLLAVFVPILAIRVFQHAFAERWNEHRRLARITFPIWMFVSVTGVIIYGMLYHWPWPAEAGSQA
ncbi:MAG: DUF420 domain-containing protein [Planctomycetaceae bacterium]|nr:DUF420 domain-containing protein [Planctomycetaceae bacterium]